MSTRKGSLHIKNMKTKVIPLPRLHRTLKDTQDWVCTKCRDLQYADKILESFKREYNALVDIRVNSRREIEIRDTLIKRLQDRNNQLEDCLRKAIKIMKHPNVIREAFLKFNFEKFVYVSEKMDEEREKQKSQSPTVRSEGEKVRVDDFRSTEQVKSDLDDKRKQHNKDLTGVFD